MPDARSIAATGLILCSATLQGAPECTRDFSSSTAASIETVAACARDGNAGAQLALAQYFASMGEDADNEFLAATWFLAAAKNGNIEAQYQIGLMYLDGRGITDDAIEGFEWIAEAARQGHAEAESVYHYLLENPEPMEC